ncbi:EAL domain-containing protein [Fredinandcohnia sp. 179-A 10B2 NHS]|uniref:EAL domain-containing protein n=1 Tax=Fredinandcohnia sp. 179-A 10B2 NHS TaxID=3235176 RepID=UPI0039A3E3CE
MASLPFLKQIRKGSIPFTTRTSVDGQTLHNEEMFKGLFENHPSAVFVIDVEGKVKCFNHSAALMYGITENGIHKNLNYYYENREIETYTNLALTGKAQNHQTIATNKMGKSFHVDITYIPIMDGNKRIIGLYKIAKDITTFVQRKEEVDKIKESLELAQQVGKMGSWDFNIEADEIYWSNQLFHLTGREILESFTPSFEEALLFVHPEDREQYRNTYYNALLNGENYSAEYRLVRRDGTVSYVTEQAEVMLDENEIPIRYIGTLLDITKRKLAEMKLEEAENRIEYIYNNLEVGIWSYDVTKREYILLSKGIEIITGYTPSDFHNRLTWDSLIHPDDFQSYTDLQCKLQEGVKLEHQYRIIHRQGDVIWVQDQTQPVLDANGNLIRIDGIVSNITPQKEYEKQIKHLAFHDSITDLPNRILFERKLQSLLNEGSNCFTVMYLDLDRFYMINDSLGHRMGDELIKKFCKRITALLPSNTMFARISGDEFGIVIWEYGQSDYPIKVAKTIVESLVKPFLIEEYELFLTTSIGVTTYPSNGENVDDLIKNAAVALYRAKSMGKNTYQIYSSTLNISTFRQYDLERDLRKSISDNQLVLHFQPRVDASTGRIVSAEALVRWEHPVWGLVAPNEFIPLAEETGFINDISDWVLQKVCQTLNDWKDESLRIVPISINIAAQRFLKNDWKTVFSKILEKHHTDPSFIELEITETTIIKHEKAIESAFAFLKELGIKISLDDFGTGYSSLSYIKNYAIDAIKIDQSFIKQIKKSQNVEMIIKSLIFMAKGLEINVVAEGVETNEQLHFLRQLECNEIQGYIYSKPVPKQEFGMLLKNNIIKPKANSKRDIQKERRKYYRIQPLFPLSANMTLISIQGKRVDVGSTEVVIEDIGPGGIKFLSTIQLPIRPDVLFEFETVIMGQVEKVMGNIVWKEESKGIFQYGLEFAIDESSRDCIIKKLHHFSLQLRNNPYLEGCSFIKDDKYSYLKKLRPQHT